MDNEKDLKTEVSETEQPSGDGQPEEESAKLKALEEEKAKLAEELEKIKSDRDNYREGLLALKAKKTTLTPEEDDEEESSAPQGEAPVEDDEAWKRVENLAEKKAREVFAKREKSEVLQNERVAIKMFMKEHPELLDDGLREAVIAEYANRNGKSVEGITLDLERAYKFYKLDHAPETPPENKHAGQLAGMPTGGKTESSAPVSDELNAVIKEMGITPESFKAFKEKVLNGEMSVPESVFNLIKNS